MADAKTINGYNIKDAAARQSIANLDTVKLASSSGASGSIKFGVDSGGNYGYYKAGANEVTPFGGEIQLAALAPGDTNITLNFEHEISVTTIITPLCSLYGVSPTDVTYTAHNVILTFEAQSEYIIVGAKIEN